MKYLYGDATPFPLEENFIETLSAATDACVRVFRVDKAIDDRRRAAHAIRERTDEELNRLTELARAVDAALGPLVPDGQPQWTAEATASLIVKGAMAQISQARNNVISQRDATIQKTLGANTGVEVRKALAAFLVEHSMPKTAWSVVWTGGAQPGEAKLSLASTSPSGVAASYKASLGEDHAWTGPVCIHDLCPDLPLVFQRSTKRLGRQKTIKELVQRYYITKVEVSPGRAWFEIQRTTKKASTGYEITMRGPRQSSPLIRPLTAEGEKEDALSLAGENALALSQLWHQIEKALRGMVALRDAADVITLNNTDVSGIDEPGHVAEVILMSLAPYIREMRVRSRVPGELVLKRDLGDGRREELFVPREKIEQKFADLPQRYQSVFEAAGLGGEATSEFVGRVMTLSAALEESDDDPVALPPVVPVAAPAA